MQRPFSSLQPTWLWRRGYLEVEFDAIDLFPQDYFSADVLKECLNQETRNLKQSIGSMVVNLSKGGFTGTPGGFVFLSVMSVADDFTRGNYLYLASFRKLQSVLPQSLHHFHLSSSDERYPLGIQRPRFATCRSPSE